MDRERIIGNLALYFDLKADVRYSNSHVPIRQLVTPNDPEVKEIADILYEDPDFIGACQAFINSFTTYAHEEGDYWSIASETLENRAGDCDCLSILLCSLLRVHIPAEKAYCAVGIWNVEGRQEGHMYVVVDENGEDRIIESTAGPEVSLTGSYDLYAIFNDKYAFATKQGLALFDLKPVEEQSVNVGR
jgi:hypothetical protein